MMVNMLTVIGQVIRPDGWTLQANALGQVDEVAWVPANAYLSDQPPDLAVHFDHDRSWTLGQVGYLERSDRLGLMALATLDADVIDLLADGPWYWSDSITCKRNGQALERTDALLRELSLVRRTANCQTRPVVAVPGDIARGTATQPRHMPWTWDDTWQRAADDMVGRRYRRNLHMVIHDVDPPPVRNGAAYTGPRVRWFGQELGGELAEAVIDAIRFGYWPPSPVA
jgi:hypothetical protein